MLPYIQEVLVQECSTFATRINPCMWAVLNVDNCTVNCVTRKISELVRVSAMLNQPLRTE